jgi:hypothetical protein
VRWGLGIAALGCKGQATQWAASGAVLPPAPPLTWSPCLKPAGWIALTGNLPVFVPFTPPDPPPRPLCS